MLSQKILSTTRPLANFYCTIAIPLTKKEEYYKETSKPPGWDEAKPFETIPGPKPLPLIGNVWRFLPGGEYYKMQMTDLHARFQEQYGNFVALKGVPGVAREVYIVYDPNDVETMHRNEGIWPIRAELATIPYYREHVRKDVFQGVGGLLTTNGEDWGKVRTVVNPIMMQPKTTIRYTGVMDDIANDVIKMINLLMTKNKEMPEDFANLFHKWALEAIAAVALDTRLGCLDPNLPKDSVHMKYINCILEMFDLLHQLEIEPSAWKWLSTPTWKRYVEIMDYVTFVNVDYIKKTIERVEKNPAKDHEAGVLEKLIKKDRKIAMAMVMDMLLAGVDTTGRTMSAATYFLARYPEKQKRLLEEAKRLLPTKDTKITKEILANAPYLKAVIKETTRLAPVATANIRMTAKDTVIQGYQVPKGTWVLSAQYWIATSEKFVKKPKDFIPERWLRNETDSEYSHKNMHPFSYLPFGFGARSCIGKRFANLELEVGLLKIVRNFEMSWPHEDMPFASKMLYGISGPLKIHMKAVND